jgi:hypothetical protein
MEGENSMPRIAGWAGAVFTWELRVSAPSPVFACLCNKKLILLRVSEDHPGGYPGAPG